MKLTNNKFFDVLMGITTGLISALIFVTKSGWNNLNMNYPLSYFADPIYYANLVRNAQSGSALLGTGLSAPSGQQYGLSAYGFEWIQSHFIALFAAENNGPWLALNRFSLYTFVATGFCGYIALRWMKVGIFPASIGAIAFTLIPNHQVISPGLGNMSALVLSLGIIWKLASGQQLVNLFIGFKTNNLNFKFKLIFNSLILLFICLFQLTAALYYIMFTTLLSGSLCIYLLLRRRKIKELVTLLIFISFQIITMLIALLPIILGRFNNDLPFSEPSTGDRRPFAAYANGGDLFAIFSPFSANSLYFKFISQIPSIKTFYSEYFGSPITLGSEYIFYPSGFVFVGLLIFALIFVLRTPRDHKFNFIEIEPFIVLIGLTLGWYLRGGFGTYFSFIFPYVRGYARFSAILIFMGIAFTSYLATQKNQYWMKNVTKVLLSIILIDSVSNVSLINQSLSKGEVRVVGEQELPGGSVLAKGIELRTLGYFGTKELIRESESKFAKNCSIAVLPLASFMLDFKIGITSYYTLELIKPGLEPSSLKWSSGGINGTPNNFFTDSNLVEYQNGKYSKLFDDIEVTGFCGVLMFRGLHKAFFEAGPKNGSNYGNPDLIMKKLIKRYGEPCYSDLESAVDLFCINDNKFIG